LQNHGKQVIDLTLAAIGPFVVPSVNMEANLYAPNVNMVTCGGQATRGTAIIILNPAEPPLIMRDTVLNLCDDGDQKAISASVEDMVKTVSAYVPGYRLKQQVQFEKIRSNVAMFVPDMDQFFTGLKVSVFLGVEGAAHYLPAYAGNLDIMTSAALRTAERLVELRA